MAATCGFIIILLIIVMIVIRKHHDSKHRILELKKEIDEINIKLDQSFAEKLVLSKKVTKLEDEICFKDEQTTQQTNANSDLQSSLAALQLRMNEALSATAIPQTTGQVYECFDSVVSFVNKLNSKKNGDKRLAENINSAIFTEAFIKLIINMTDLRLNGLASKLAEDKFALKTRDINITCMHFCGFSNASILAYMQTTDEHYVTTRKRIIAKRVMKNSEKINDLLTFFGID